MATTLYKGCRCGKRLCIFVTKAMLADHLNFSLEDKQAAVETDREEEEAGEIEHAKGLAESLGVIFVDGRGPEPTCSECGLPADWQEGVGSG